jgi:recombination protein RecR
MPDSLKYLIDAFAKLPWVGEKTAMKLAFFILTKKKELTLELAEKLTTVYKNIDICPTCGALKDISRPVCNYCDSDKRDKQILCVVEEYADLLAIEQTGVYKGLYHVLGGSLSPLYGRGPKDLTFDVLFSRLKGIEEIIIATNPNFEWEATALYLRDHLATNIRTTRLSRGLPNAGYIDYVDSLTLMNALKGRQEYS